METRKNRIGWIVRINVGSELDRLQGADRLADRIVNDLDVIRPEYRSPIYVNGLADYIHAVMHCHEEHYEIPATHTMGGFPVIIEA